MTHTKTNRLQRVPTTLSYWNTLTLHDIPLFVRVEEKRFPIDVNETIYMIRFKVLESPGGKFTNAIIGPYKGLSQIETRERCKNYLEKMVFFVYLTATTQSTPPKTPCVSKR